MLDVASPDDAPAIAAIYAPYVRDTIISFEVEPPTADAMRQRIEGVLLRHTWLIARLGGDVVGYAYASDHRSRLAYQWSVDVAIYLAPNATGRGIGSRLYRALFALLEPCGYVNAYAGITLPNAGSVALHERLGFEVIGVYRNVGHKLGAWHDVGWWGKRLGAAIVDPPPPRAPRDLSTRVVARALHQE